MADHLWCDKSGAQDGGKTDCPQLQSDFARHDLKLRKDELGGSWLYPRELLWRIWRDYPDTNWGERAFAFLLNMGWDTSRVCEKGETQFHEVIRQGGIFLQHHSSSPYKTQVTLMVGPAYETWWTLSRVRIGVDLAGYADPKEYQEGAEAVRLKAIVYYKQVVQAAPETRFEEFAHERIGLLRNKQWTLTDGWAKFFCIYD